jgi:maleylpyruvate isomerase
MRLALYSYWRSSSSWRVRIGLSLKGLAHEYRAVNLLAGEQFADEHRERNAMMQVPVLDVAEDWGQVSGQVTRLVQSMAILEWLEERFPEPPLLPADPSGRARVRALAEIVNAGIQPLQNAIVTRLLAEEAPGLRKTFPRQFIERGLAALERGLQDGSTGRFCHGDQPGLADCYLVPQLYSARRFGVELAPFPTLRRIEEACLALPQFQVTLPDRQPDAPPPDRRTP